MFGKTKRLLLWDNANYKSLYFNGVDTYVDMNIGTSGLLTLLGTGQANPISGGIEHNYHSLVFDIFVPSSIALGKTLLAFAQLTSNTAKWELKINTSNKQRLSIVIVDTGSSTITSPANCLNLDAWNRVAIIQKRRPSYAAGWIRHEFWLNNVLTGTTDTFLTRLFSTWQTAGLGALLKSTASNHAEFYIDLLKIYNRDLTSTEVGNLYNNTPVTTNLMLEYNFNKSLVNQVNPGTYDGIRSTPPPSYRTIGL